MRGEPRRGATRVARAGDGVHRVDRDEPAVFRARANRRLRGPHGAGPRLQSAKRSGQARRLVGIGLSRSKCSCKFLIAQRLNPGFRDFDEKRRVRKMILQASLKYT